MRMLWPTLLMGIVLSSCFYKDKTVPEPLVYQGCLVTTITDSATGKPEYTFEYDKYRRISKQVRYFNGEQDLSTTYTYGTGKVVWQSFNKDGSPYKSPQKATLNAEGYLSGYIENEESWMLSDSTILTSKDTATYTYNSANQLSTVYIQSTLFFTKTTTEAVVRRGWWKYTYADGNIVQNEYTWTSYLGTSGTTVDYFYDSASPTVSFAPIDDSYIRPNLYGRSQSGKVPSKWIRVDRNEKGEVTHTSTTTTTAQVDARGAPTKIRYSELSQGSSNSWPSTKLYTCDCQ